MKISVDLTKKKFDIDKPVNLYNSKTIFFDATTLLPETVSFKVWGAGITPNFIWGNYLNLDSDPKLKSLVKKSKKDEISIQGFGVLTFEQVIAGKIIISPYDNGEFLKNKKGEEVKLIREWSLDKMYHGCYSYLLNTTIYFPYGNCLLTFYAEGNVSFEFDTEDCVEHIEYITNPDRRHTFWGYLKDKNISTNSYYYEDLDPRA